MIFQGQLSTFLSVWFLILGTVVGSFLNVIIYRLPNGFKISLPRRSFCQACKTKLTWFENIPLLSFLALRGKCRHCQATISPRYFLVELLTALIFYGVYQHFGFSWSTFINCYFCASLIAITFIDLDHFIIPDEITYSGLVVGLAGSLLNPEFGFLNAALGAAIGSLVMWLIGQVYFKITKREGLGLGDVKLIAMIGAFLGWQGSLFTMIGSSFLGSFLGMIIMVVQRKNLKMAIPYGPFLAIAAMFYLFWGDQIVIRLHSF